MRECKIYILTWQNIRVSLFVLETRSLCSVVFRACMIHNPTGNDFDNAGKVSS